MSAAKDMSSATSELIELVEPTMSEGLDLTALSEVETSAKHKGDKFIGVGEDFAPENVLSFAIENGIRHIVQTSGLELEKELNVAALMLNQQDTFLNFPLSSILTPVHAGSVKESESACLVESFSKATEKKGILDRLEVEVDKITKALSLKSQIVAVADELITNAVFNAPFIKGNGGNGGVDRGDRSVEMGVGKQAKFFVGHDSHRIVIGCADPFGTLNLEQLLLRVRECYRLGVGENMNMGQGGAGIGSFLVYNTCTSFYAAVDGGRTTVVACSMPLKMSGVKRSQIPKNIHLMSIEEDSNGTV